MLKPISTAVFALFISMSVKAATHTLTGDFTITDFSGASLGTAIQTGDTFHFNLTYDDSILDSDPSVTVGQFDFGILAGGTLTRTGGTGTWDPASGTLNSGIAFTLHSTADDFQTSTTGTGFAPANGIPFYFLSVGLQHSPPNFLNDTGAGQTLAQQLSDQPVMSLPWETGFGEIDFFDGEFVSGSANFEFTLIPEPSTCALGLLGLGVLAFRRRRQHR